MIREATESEEVVETKFQVPTALNPKPRQWEGFVLNC